MKKFNKTIALFLVFGMFLTINPLQSSAKWDSKKDQLPGYDDGKSTTALLIGGGVVIGVVIYLVIKKNKQKKATGGMEYHKTMQVLLWENQINKMYESCEKVALTTESIEATLSSAFPLLPEKTLMQQIDNSKNTIPVDLVVAPLSNPHFAMGQTNGFQVGLRIRF